MRFTIIFFVLVSFGLQAQKLNKEKHSKCLVEVDSNLQNEQFVIVIKTNRKDEITKVKRGFLIHSNNKQKFQPYYSIIKLENIKRSSNWHYYDAACYDVQNVKDTISVLDLVTTKKSVFEKNVFWNHKDEFGLKLQVCNIEDGSGNCWELILSVPKLDSLNMGTQMDISNGIIRADYLSSEAHTSHSHPKRQIYGQFTPISFDNNLANFNFKIYVRDFWDNVLVAFEGERTLVPDH